MSVDEQYRSMVGQHGGIDGMWHAARVAFKGTEWETAPVAQMYMTGSYMNKNIWPHLWYLVLPNKKTVAWPKVIECREIKGIVFPM